MKFASSATLALALMGISSWANAGHVLVVLSDSDSLQLKDGKTHATGFYLNELMEPVKMLLDAGDQVTFATPEGRVPTMDKGSADAASFGGDSAALATHLALLEKLKVTSLTDSPVISLARAEQMGYDRFDAVYVPGGHAPMQDLAISPQMGKLLRAFHARHKTTALVCHGPVALISALQDASSWTQKLAADPHIHAQKWIYAGYRMTSFTNAEEEASKAIFNGGALKFTPETALTQAGGQFSKAAEKWQGYLVEDRELITGQNPASAKLVGQRLVALLAEHKS